MKFIQRTDPWNTKQSCIVSPVSVDNWVNSHMILINIMWNFICNCIKSLQNVPNEVFFDFCLLVYKNSKHVPDEFPLDFFPKIIGNMSSETQDDESKYDNTEVLLQICQDIKVYLNDIGYSYIFNKNTFSIKLLKFFNKYDAYEYNYPVLPIQPLNDEL